MNKELAKTLTLALVNYIDENRPEGAMDCSSGECVSLEKAFTEENFDSVETLIKKKLSRLTEFEKGLINFYNKRNEIPSDKDGVYNKHDLEEFLHESAKTLLALAKKELCNGCNANLEGCTKTASTPSPSQSLKDIGIVNELIDQKGVAIVDTIDNYSGHQTINTIRFVGEDEDKPKPLPCKYYHVWLKAAKEEEL